MSVGIRKMPADICCCCWLSLAKKRRNKKNTVFLPQCLYQGSSATGMWFFGRFVFFYFLFLRFSSSPQCLCQGNSATGMRFSGRFIIFSFSLSSPVPPLLRFPVLPFFSPLFLFFFLCFYIFTFFSACIKKTPLSLCWRQSVGCLIKGKGVFF